MRANPGPKESHDVTTVSDSFNQDGYIKVARRVFSSFDLLFLQSPLKEGLISFWFPLWKRRLMKKLIMHLAFILIA